MPGERSGKYTLHLIGRNGPGVAVHMEYLIHIGAYAELVLDHGWARGALEFERGEFDIVGLGTDDKESLLVEAKARAEGSDSLAALRDSLLAASADEAFHISVDNHRRKWEQLCRVVADKPVDVLLVADSARWWFRASRVDSGRVTLARTAG